MTAPSTNNATRPKTYAPDRSYNGLAKTLHWLVFVLLVVQFAVAWTMPHIGRTTPVVGLVLIHAYLGLCVLLAVVVRILWRFTYRPPPLPTSRGERILARAIEGTIYLLLLAVPILGWIDGSARGWHVTIGGMTVPSIWPVDANNAGKLGDYHTFIATYLLIGFVVIHALAALYHHFVRRDDVLRTMLPGA